MRILSKYHDYYDHIAYQYGADNTIIYNRQPFTSTDEFKKVVNKALDSIQYKQGSLLSYAEYTECRFRWLVINGCLYLLVKRKKDSHFKLITEELLSSIIADIKKYRVYTNTKNYTLDKFINFVDLKEKMIDAHNIINQPVFVIEYPHTKMMQFGDFIIDNNITRYYIPLLSETGLPSIYPAEQIYQDISYFMGNEMKSTPDIKPPVEISNDNKIEGHGFDLKQSFRHRK